MVSRGELVLSSGARRLGLMALSMGRQWVRLALVSTDGDESVDLVREQLDAELGERGRCRGVKRSMASGALVRSSWGCGSCTWMMRWP